MLDKDDTERGGRWLDTLDMRSSACGFYSSYGLERRHHHHLHHPYRRSEKKYFLEEFKKLKHPTFDGEVKKS